MPFDVIHYKIVTVMYSHQIPQNRIYKRLREYYMVFPQPYSKTAIGVFSHNC